MRWRSAELRLRPTRRALTLAGGTALLAGGGAAGLSLLSGRPSGPVVAAAASPLLVDVAAWALAPAERRLVLERYRRRAQQRLRRVHPKVVAITGSWGKTSTKNHVRDLLAGSFEVVASPASWNNMAGLSRTVNEHLGPGCEVLVAEMGMYAKGEIAAMCAWVVPDVSVICEIGPMHLERLGTIERIVEAKAEILDGAAQAVLWVANPWLAALAEERAATQKLWRVGWAGSDTELDVAVAEDGDVVRVWANGSEVGAYRADSGAHPGNVGCAVAVALAFGVDRQALGRRLVGLSVPPHRGESGRSARGTWVIDDTFNSNPKGAAAAVAALAARCPQGRRAVVTPGMVELGSMQAQANRDLAAAVVDSGATLVVVGWTNRAALVEGATGTTAGTVVTVADRAAARRWVQCSLGEGDAVLWENDLPVHYP